MIGGGHHPLPAGLNGHPNRVMTGAAGTVASIG
jgi:hypothetical protein